MTIKDFKKAILDDYKESKERKIGDFWSDEIKEGLDEILNYTDITILDDDIKNGLAEIELSELADGMVDVYTTELLKWYLEDIKRISYADDFMSEMGGGDDFSKILMGGEYMYYTELLNCVFSLINEELEKL